MKKGSNNTDDEDNSNTSPRQQQQTNSSRAERELSTTDGSLSTLASKRSAPYSRRLKLSSARKDSLEFKRSDNFDGKYQSIDYKYSNGSSINISAVQVETEVNKEKPRKPNDVKNAKSARTHRHAASKAEEYQGNDSQEEPSHRIKHTKRTFVNPNFLSRTSSEISYSKLNKEARDRLLRPDDRSKAGSENGLRPSRNNLTVKKRSQKACACANCGKRIQHFKRLPPKSRDFSDQQTEHKSNDDHFEQSNQQAELRQLKYGENSSKERLSIPRNEKLGRKIVLVDPEREIAREQNADQNDRIHSKKMKEKCSYCSHKKHGPPEALVDPDLVCKKSKRSQRQDADDSYEKLNKIKCQPGSAKPKCNCKHCLKKEADKSYCKEVPRTYCKPRSAPRESPQPAESTYESNSSHTFSSEENDCHRRKRGDFFKEASAVFAGIPKGSNDVCKLTQSRRYVRQTEEIDEKPGRTHIKNQNETEYEEINLTTSKGHVFQRMPSGENTIRKERMSSARSCQCGRSSRMNQEHNTSCHRHSRPDKKFSREQPPREQSLFSEGEKSCQTDSEPFNPNRSFNKSTYGDTAICRNVPRAISSIKRPCICYSGPVKQPQEDIQLPQKPPPQDNLKDSTEEVSNRSHDSSVASFTPEIIEEIQHGNQCQCTVCKDRKKCNEIETNDPNPVKSLMHGTRCRCNICTDKTLCEIPVQVKSKSRTEPVRTKHCDIAPLLQHPRIPAAIPDINLTKDKCPCAFSERLMPCTQKENIKTKANSAVQLLKKPRIPPRISAGYTSEEDKEIHTYDCTCKICQDPTIEKHPVEVKKKKWKLPWSSSQPVEVKPKPRPVEIKPWKVAEIFQHPRIPLRQTDQPMSPQASIQSCACKEKQATPKTMIKENGPAKPVPSKPTECIDLGHRPGCTCPICEKRLLCSTKKMPVETKSHDVSQMLQRPKIHDTAVQRKAAGSQPNDYSGLITTKHKNKVNLFQHPRLPTYSSTCSRTPESQHVRDCACFECTECRKAPEKATDCEEHFKQNSIQKKPWYVSDFLQHPRIPNATDDKPAQIRSETGSKEVCPCSQMQLERRKAGSCFPSLTCFKRSEPSNPKSVKSWPIVLKNFNENMVKLCQRPRIPQYTWTPGTCQCTGKCEDSSKCGIPLRQSEKPLKFKPLNLSSLLQHPRIPMQIDTRSPIKLIESTQECPCSQPVGQSHWNKVRTHISALLNTCQRPRIPNAIEKNEHDPKNSEDIRKKKANLINIFQKPRVLQPIDHVKSCDCLVCQAKSKCKTLHQLTEQPVETKPRPIENLLQHPRIPVLLDLQPKVPRKPKDALDYCPCSTTKEKINWDHVIENLIKFLRTCRKPRILQRIKYQPEKSLSEPVLTKPSNIANMFQRPRIPTPIPQRTACNCEPCQGDAQCQKLELQPSYPVEIKPKEISSLLQRPRITPPIVNGIKKKPPEMDKTTCPCDPKENLTVRKICAKLGDLFTTWQRPRIGRSTDQRRTQSDTTLIKPNNLINVFGKPRIRPNVIHSKDCDCLVCRNKSKCGNEDQVIDQKESEPIQKKPLSILQTMQRPRITRINFDRESSTKKHTQESCPCENTKEKIKFPVALLQKPRIQHAVETSRMSAGKTQPQNMIIKQHYANFFLKRPRIPLPVNHQSECNCTGCRNETNCKIENTKVESEIVKHKSLKNILQKPRIPKQIDSKIHEEPSKVKKDDPLCPCQPKTTTSFSINMFQKPRIPNIVGTNEQRAVSDTVLTKRPNALALFQHPRVGNRVDNLKSCDCTQCKEGQPCLKPQIQVKQRIHKKPLPLESLLQRPRIPNIVDTNPKREEDASTASKSCPCEPKEKVQIPFNVFQRPRIPMATDSSEQRSTIQTSNVRLIRKHNLASPFQRPRVPSSEPRTQCICEQCKSAEPCSKDLTKTSIITKPMEVLTKPFSGSTFAQRPRIPNAIDSRLRTQLDKLADDPHTCPCKPKSKSMVSLNFFQRPRIPMPIESDQRKVAGKSSDIVLTKKHDIVSIFQHPRIPVRDAPPATCTCSQCKEGQPCGKEFIPKEKHQEVLTKPFSRSVFSQRPRIPNAIDTHPKKGTSIVIAEIESCPCKEKEKRTISLNVFQKPRIPKTADISQRQIAGHSSDIVLIKNQDKMKIFQHPRIPFREVPPLTCTCNQCINGQPCGKGSIKKFPCPKTEKLLTKPFSKSTFIQRPRITAVTNSRPTKDPPSLTPQPDACPCASKSKHAVSVQMFQRPRIPMPIDTVCKELKGGSSETIITKKHDIVSIFQHPRIFFRERSPPSCTCNQCKEGLPCGKTKTENIQITKPQEVLIKPYNRATFAHPRIPNAIDCRPQKEPPPTAAESELCPCKPKGRRTISLNFFQRPRILKSVDTDERQVAGQATDIRITKKQAVVSTFQHARIPIHEAPAPTCTCSQCKEGYPCDKPPIDECPTAKPTKVLTKPISRPIFAQRPRILNAIDSRLPKEPPTTEPELCPCKPKNRRVVSLGFLQRPRIPMPVDNAQRKIASDATLTTKHDLVSFFQHPRITFREASPTACTCNQCKEGEPCGTSPIKKSTIFEPIEVLKKPFSRSVFAHPRIPNPIDYRPAKKPPSTVESGSCPCKPKEKRTISVQFFQQPRIPMPVDTAHRQVTGQASDVAVTKKHDIVSIFQHPRIPIREPPPTTCTCNQCLEGEPCGKLPTEKPSITKPTEALTKPVSKSVFARPRILNAVDSRPKTEPPSAPELESCPCTPKEKRTVSLNFCQRPRIPMPVDKANRQVAGQTSDVAITKKHDIVSIFQHPRIPFRDAPLPTCPCNQCKGGAPCGKTPIEKPPFDKQTKMLTKPLSRSVFARPRIPNAIDSRPSKEPPSNAEPLPCPCKPNEKRTMSLSFLQRPRIPMPVDTAHRQVAGQASDVTITKQNDIVSIFQHPRIPFREAPPPTCTCNQCLEGEPCDKPPAQKPSITKPTEVLRKPVSKSVFARPRVLNAIDSLPPKEPPSTTKSESCPCKPKEKRTVSLSFCQRPRIPMPVDKVNRQVAGQISDVAITKKHDIVSIFQHPRMTFREAPPQSCTCNQCKEGEPCRKALIKKSYIDKPTKVLTKSLSTSVFGHPRIPNAVDSRPPKEPPSTSESLSCPCKPKEQRTISLNFFQRPRILMPVDTAHRQVAGHASDVAIAKKHDIVNIFQHPRIPFREAPPPTCKCSQCLEGEPCGKPPTEKPSIAKPTEVLIKPISKSVFARPRILNAVDSLPPKEPLLTTNSESCPCKPKKKRTVSLNFCQRPRISMPVDKAHRQVAGQISDIAITKKHNIVSIFQHPRITFREAPPTCTCNQCKEGEPCRKAVIEKFPIEKPTKVLTKPLSTSVFGHPRIPNVVDSRPPKEPPSTAESLSCPCKPKEQRMISLNFFQRPRIPMPVDTAHRQVAGQASDVAIAKKHDIVSIFQRPRIPFREAPRPTCKCNQCLKGEPCGKPPTEKPFITKPTEVLTKPASKSVFARPRILNAVDSLPPKEPPFTTKSESCPCKPKEKRTVSLNFCQRPRIPMPVDKANRQVAGQISDVAITKKHNIVSIFQHPRITFREAPPPTCTCNQCKEGEPCRKALIEKSSIDKPTKVLTKSLSTSVFGHPRIPNAVDSRPPKGPPSTSESLSCPCKPKEQHSISLNFFQRPRIPMPVDTSHRQIAGQASDVAITKKHDIASIFQHPRIPFREAPPPKCKCNQCLEGEPCGKPPIEKPSITKPTEVLTKPVSKSVFTRPRILSAIDSLPPKKPSSTAKSESCPCSPKEQRTVSLNFCQRPRIPMPVEKAHRQVAGEVTDVATTKKHDIVSIFQHPRIPFHEAAPETCTCNQCLEGEPCGKTPTEKPSMTKPTEVLTKPVSRSVFARPRILNAVDSRPPKRPASTAESESCPCKPKQKWTVSLNFFQRPRILMPVETAERKVAGQVSDVAIRKKHDIVSIFQHPRILFRNAPPPVCTCNQCKEGEPCGRPPVEKSSTLKASEVLTKPFNRSIFARPRIPNTIDFRSRKEPASIAAESESCPCKPKNKRTISLNFFKKPRILMPVGNAERQSEGQSSQVTITRKHDIVSIFQHPRIPFREAPVPACTCNRCKAGERCEKAPIENAAVVKSQNILIKPFSWAAFAQRPRIPNAIDSRPPKERLTISAEELCPCKPKEKRTVLLNLFQRPRIPMPVDSTERHVGGNTSDIALKKTHDIASIFQHPRIPVREAPLPTCTCDRCKEGKPCGKLPTEKMSITKPHDALTKPSNRSVFVRPRILNAIDSRSPKKSEPNITEPNSCPCKPKNRRTVPANIFQRPRIPMPVNSDARQVAGQTSDIVLTKKHNIINIFQHPRLTSRESQSPTCTCKQCETGQSCGRRSIEKQPIAKPQQVLTKPVSRTVFAQRPRIPNSTDYRPVKLPGSKMDETDSCSCKSKSKRTVSLNFIQRPRIPMPVDIFERHVKSAASDIVLTRKHRFVSIFQHPRIPLRETPPPTCACNQCKEGLPCNRSTLAKPEKVLTKPTSKFGFAQRPRIPYVINDRPAIESKLELSKDDQCNCKSKEKSKISLNFLQRPRIPLPVDTSKRHVAGKTTNTVVQKPANYASLFQHPRIPMSQQLPSNSCCCTECVNGGTCQKVAKTKSENILTKSENILTKPYRVSNLAQHPRIPIPIDSRLTPKANDVRPVVDSCGCQPKIKRSISLSMFQHPRVLQAVDTSKKGDFRNNEKVATTSRKAVNLFQRPRIVPSITHKCHHSLDNCTCLKDKCNHSNKENTEQIISTIVRTKPFTIFSLFQHPRIPIHPAKRKVMRSPAQESSHCTCQKNEKKIGPTVKVKPWYASSIFQHPRISAMNAGGSRHKPPTDSFCCCSDNETVHPGDPCSACGKIVKKKSTQDKVHLKSDNIASLCQKPRIPNQSDKPCLEGTQKVKPCSRRECGCENCNVEEFPPSCAVLHENRHIRVKSREMRSVLQHPRIPIHKNRSAGVKLKKSPCSACRIGAGHQHSEFELVQTKGVPLSNVFQHPRIPNLLSKRSRYKKICKCHICLNREACEIVYDKGTSCTKVKKLLEETPHKEETVMGEKNENTPKNESERLYFCKNCKSTSCKEKQCNVEQRCCKTNNNDVHLAEKANKPAGNNDCKTGCYCNICKERLLCKNEPVNRHSECPRSKDKLYQKLVHSETTKETKAALKVSTMKSNQVENILQNSGCKSGCTCSTCQRSPPSQKKSVKIEGLNKKRTSCEDCQQGRSCQKRHEGGESTVNVAGKTIDNKSTPIDGTVPNKSCVSQTCKKGCRCSICTENLTKKRNETCEKPGKDGIVDFENRTAAGSSANPIPIGTPEKIAKQSKDQVRAEVAHKSCKPGCTCSICKTPKNKHRELPTQNSHMIAIGNTAKTDKISKKLEDGKIRSNEDIHNIEFQESFDTNIRKHHSGCNCHRCKKQAHQPKFIAAKRAINKPKTECAKTAADNQVSSEKPPGTCKCIKCANKKCTHCDNASKLIGTNCKSHQACENHRHVGGATTSTMENTTNLYEQKVASQNTTVHLTPQPSLQHPETNFKNKSKLNCKCTVCETGDRCQKTTQGTRTAKNASHENLKSNCSCKCKVCISKKCQKRNNHSPRADDVTEHVPKCDSQIAGQNYISDTYEEEQRHVAGKAGYDFAAQNVKSKSSSTTTQKECQCENCKTQTCRLKMGKPKDKDENERMNAGNTTDLPPESGKPEQECTKNISPEWNCQCAKCTNSKCKRKANPNETCKKPFWFKPPAKKGESGKPSDKVSSGSKTESERNCTCKNCKDKSLCRYTHDEPETQLERSKQSIPCCSKQKNEIGHGGSCSKDYDSKKNLDCTCEICQDREKCRNRKKKRWWWFK